MDLNEFAQNADLKRQFDEYLQKSQEKKRKIKKAEVDKIKQGFREFFKSNPAYVLTSTGNSIVAACNGSQIILHEDEMSNNQGASMRVDMKVVVPNQKEEVVFTTISSDWKPQKPQEAKTDVEIMERDLEYHKAFVNGEVTYTFKYMIKGRKKEFETFGEVMKEL